MVFEHQNAIMIGLYVVIGLFILYRLFKKPDREFQDYYEEVLNSEKYKVKGRFDE